MVSRSIRMLVLLLGLAGTTGCMVMEEMDKAAELMPGQEQSSASDASAGSPGAEAAAPNPLLERSKQWWDRATSIAPTELDTKIVRCRLDGRTQFMPRDDCRSRGGRPERVSG